MSERPGRAAPPAFLFFGVFGSRTEVLDDVRRRITERYGPLHPQGESATFAFPETRTYAKTMGTALRRRFYVLARRWPQDGLAAVKRAAIDMEDEVRERFGAGMGVERPANIDPGLINDCRIILASTKDHAHRIYRGDGIWEEVTLVYREGRYRELPWTYRDFRSPEYHAFFAEFRAELLGREG